MLLRIALTYKHGLRHGNDLQPAQHVRQNLQTIKIQEVGFKGTVSRDFRLLVFFMNQFPSLVYHYRAETVLIGYSGAGGKLIHEKTRSKKSRDTVPLNFCKDMRCKQLPWVSWRCPGPQCTAPCCSSPPGWASRSGRHPTDNIVGNYVLIKYRVLFYGVDHTDGPCLSFFIIR